MNSTKCRSCGLTNFSSETECRRCGFQFEGPKSKARAREKTPRSFSFTSLLMIVGVGAVAYYFYGGTEKSLEEVNAKDAKRVASQPANQGTGLSRTKYDQQRASNFAATVRNSQSLNEHQKRVQETERTVQQLANTQSGK